METTATRGELEKALQAVNVKYDGNVIFNRIPEARGKRQVFTLRVKSSKGPGHSIGFYNSRRLTSACWHVHGYFFEALLSINPDATIWTRGNKIDKDGGNWIDWNAGSIVNPLYMSEKCGC